jgi:hypothetical protein
MMTRSRSVSQYKVNLDPKIKGSSGQDPDWRRGWVQGAADQGTFGIGHKADPNQSTGLTKLKSGSRPRDRMDRIKIKDGSGSTCKALPDTGGTCGSGSSKSVDPS